MDINHIALNEIGPQGREFTVSNEAVWLEPLKQYAKEHHKANGDVATYIFGHMHIPHHAVCEGVEMLFLSDWSREEATYAQMDGSSVELKTFKIDETIS